MTGNQLSAVRILYARGASFTRLRGKIPVDTGWQSRPRETEDEALAMAGAGNIGLRTGANSGGIVVIDVEAEAAPGAYEALGLPPTLTVKTGGGGQHYYFRTNGRRIKNSAGKLVPNIDVRGDGGQVVFPGSVHPESGRVYEFASDPAATEIAALPDEFIDRFADKILKDYKKPRPPAAPASTPRPPAPGASRYAAAALDGECRKVAGAPEGTRNDTLNAAAFSLGQLVAAGALDESTVRDALLASARQCGLHDGEAEAAIRSGMGAGMAQPRTLPEPRQRPAPPPPDAGDDDEWMPRDEDAPGGPPLPDEPGTRPPPGAHGAKAEKAGAKAEKTGGNGEEPGAKAEDAGDDEDEGPPPVDDGDGPPGYHTSNVARLFVDSNSRLIYHRDILYRYTGTCYQPMTDNELRARVVEFIIGSLQNRKLWTVMRGRERMEEPVDPSGGALGKIIDMIKGNGVINYLPDIPHWIGTGRPATNHVGLENGILNLDTYELLPHSSDCFTLAALPFAHDAAATCPRFIRFLNEIMQDDEEKLCSLQELFGYCLQSSQDGQKIFVLVGEGRNGKTVLINVLKMLIGPANCSAVPLESLHQPHATAALVGKMVNFSMEWKYLDPQAEGTLKAISGGDPVGVNPKNKPIFSTQLAAKIVIVSNEPPHITDRTSGMWRRIQIIPFTYTVPEEKTIPMDSLLHDFRAELPGILNWAVEGLRSWRQQGAFTTTQAMVAAVQDYRKASSTVWSWADDEIELAPGAQCSSQELYNRYSSFCKDNGCKAVNSINFGLDLGRWFKVRSDGAELQKVRIQTGGSRQNFYRDIGFGGGELPPGLDGAPNG